MPPRSASSRKSTGDRKKAAGILTTKKVINTATTKNPRDQQRESSSSRKKSPTEEEYFNFKNSAAEAAAAASTNVPNTTTTSDVKPNVRNQKMKNEKFAWHPEETEAQRGERLRLKGIHEAAVPEYMRESNPYILTGFRTHYTTWESIKSIFSIHNETGNIWTHLSYFWMMTVLLIYFYTQHLDWCFEHYLVFTIFAIANLWVTSCSTMYHTMSCHECPEKYRFYLMLDLTGIAVLITACFIPGIYWGMACVPFWRNLYLMMIMVLGGTSIAVPLLDRHEEWVSSTVRTTLFTLTGVSGLLPAFHFLFLVPMGIGASSRLPMGGIALMFLQYGAGLAFYLAKFPERWYPGYFDTWLSSHQLWHIGVGNAMLTYFHCAIRMYDIYNYLDDDPVSQC